MRDFLLGSIFFHESEEHQVKNLNKSFTGDMLEHVVCDFQKLTRSMIKFCKSCIFNLDSDARFDHLYSWYF